MPAVVSHRKEVNGVKTRSKFSEGSICSMSKAAINTHMKAVCAPAVPAVWTMLFSQRL